MKPVMRFRNHAVLAYHLVFFGSGLPFLLSVNIFSLELYKKSQLSLTNLRVARFI